MDYSSLSDTRGLKTVAELCEAIADGVLPSSIDRDHFVVSRRDLTKWQKESSYDKMLLMILPEKQTLLNIAS